MLPRLLAETSALGTGTVRPVPGGGWLLSDSRTDATHVLDRRLRLITTVPDRGGVVAADARHVAVVAEETLTVTDLHGKVLWSDAVADGAECHVDGRGVVWILAGDLVAAAEVATGRPVGHVRLDTSTGWSTWIDDPSGTWTGLHLQPADQPCRSWLLRHGGADAVEAKGLGEQTLADLCGDGHRYLARRDRGTRLVIGDHVTGDLLADLDVRRLADPDVDLLDAVIVSRSLALVAISLDDGPDEQTHLLLSTRTLRHRSTVTYRHPTPQRDIQRSTEPGVWLTRTDGALCLWQLDGLLDDDPIPGQQTLFEIPSL